MKNNLLLAVLVHSLACASCASVKVIPRLGQMNIDGHIGIADASTGVTATNDLDTLGLDDDSSVFSGRVDLQGGGAHATFALSSSSHGGTGVATATLDDGSGSTVMAGSMVDSDFDVTLGEAIVTWDLIPGEAIELGIGLGASVFDLDGALTDLTSGDTVDANQAVPIPVLAVRGGIDLGRLDFSALLGGVDVNIGGDEASFYDLDLMARLELFGKGGKVLGDVVLGYRYVDLQVDYEDGSEAVDAAVRLSGPYLGLSIGF